MTNLKEVSHDQIECSLRFRAAGIKKGDKVAFLCPNIPPMLEAHYAVPMIGAVLVSISVRLSSGEIGYRNRENLASVRRTDHSYHDALRPESEGIQNRPPVDDSHRAPPSPTVIEQIETMGATIIHVYGLTEVYGPHSICARQTSWEQLNKEDLARIKARQGVAYLTALYMDVVDMATMQPVPRDGKTMGEIVMRGCNVMLGYYKGRENLGQDLPRRLVP